VLSELGQGASARQTLGLGRDGSAIGQARHIPSRYARVPVWQGRHTRDLPEHSRRSVQMTRYVLLEAVKRCERRPAPARPPSLNFGNVDLGSEPRRYTRSNCAKLTIAIRFPLRRNRFHAALAKAPGCLPAQTDTAEFGRDVQDFSQAVAPDQAARAKAPPASRSHSQTSRSVKDSGRAQDEKPDAFRRFSGKPGSRVKRDIGDRLDVVPTVELRHGDLELASRNRPQRRAHLCSILSRANDQNLLG